MRDWAAVTNEDFAHTILRQFFFDAFNVPMLEALSASADPRIAEIAEKAVKEARYHLDRSREIVVALGDGTDESHGRMAEAMTTLWPYTGEMFAADDIDRTMQGAGIAPDLAKIRESWEATVLPALAEARLEAENFDETEDAVRESHGIKIAVDRKSALYLDGTELHFHDGLDQRGFVFNNPNAVKSCGCGSSFQA